MMPSTSMPTSFFLVYITTSVLLLILCGKWNFVVWTSLNTSLIYCWPWPWVIMFVILEPCDGLSCWQCIADDCHTNPANYHKATVKHCEPDQSCQKVEYRGRDVRTKTDYFSVTRSCSQGACLSHADNCTEQLLTNPGCMVRHCCRGHSLCNTAPSRDIRPVSLLAASCLISIIGGYVTVL